MRVLIFHGYLLRGTGSNVYNASLVQALAGLGHEVHLLCQDRTAGELAWVDSVGGPGRPGAVTVHNPDIGGLLPVYVADSYAGFEVKTFAQMSEEEVDRYVEANVAAVRRVIDEAGRPDAALANHLVMGPAILARAGLGAADGGPGFAAKVHGSALEYTVKPEPERFLPFAREGMEAASAVLVGSRHTAESLWAALEQPGLEEKTRLGPPGVDVDLFAPDDGAARAASLAKALGEQSGGGADAWGRDPASAAEAVEWFAKGEGPRAIFVGKLIVSKGVDLLLAAWPRVVAAHPGARLLVIGFGEYRDGLQRLWSSLAAGDREDLREIAELGRGLEGGPEQRLDMLGDFLDSAPDDYFEDAAAAGDSVRFAGRLEHDEVGRGRTRGRRPRLPEHLPRGVRDGRGRGRRCRRAAGGRRALRHRRGQPPARGVAARRGCAAGVVPARRRGDRWDRRPPRGLVRARRGRARTSARRPARDRRPPVELGGGRQRRDQRVGGAA